MLSSTDFSIQSLADNSGMVNTLKQRRIELQKLAAQCLTEINKIDNALSAFNAKPGRRLNWTKEILIFFKSNPQPQKTTQILNWIFAGNQHELEDAEKRRIYITGLSVALMNLVKKGVLKSMVVPGEKGRLYMLQCQQTDTAEPNRSKLIAV